ncbi:hypothetical protein [Flavobacterium rhizosphaerae]|uniref:DUF1700 domain-containing protein n=1 Tax=Flavobacterium rhizosphaerae TaxID=3163298 RepID=A0ABW8Z0Z2_9FLAO
MKIKELEFKEIASKRIYESYMKRISKVVKPLPVQDQNEVLLEFNSHIYEGLQRQTNKAEVEGLLDILDKLGVPEEILKPLVADKKMEQATKTFNPLHVIKALALNITNGISYIIFFILYLLLLGFVYLIFAKIVNPDTMGLFFEDEAFMVLGKTNKLNDPGVTEVLGNWFIPVMIVSIIVCYFIITFLLKLKRIINKK